MQHLDGWKSIAAVVALNAANGVAFVDLIGGTSILPAASESFTAGGSVAWAATTQMIGATVGLGLLGYLSETWSRRRMLLISISMLMLSALACPLSRYPPRVELFCVLRAFAGMATGSISNLVNIAQNDFLSQERRLKYQGIQGISVALGCILGMMVGAAFASRSQWQYFYYFVAALAACAWLAVFTSVPANCRAPERDQIRAAIRTIDIWGILSGTGFLVPGIVMLSKYSQFEKEVLVALGILTAGSLIVFIYLGLKQDRGVVRPIVPFRLFRNPTIATILVQNVLYGAAYHSFNYYMPIYLQVVRGYSPLVASAYQVPYYVTHGTTSTLSALFIRHLQHKGGRSYSLVFYTGFATWACAMFALSVDSSFHVEGLAILFNVMVGIGTGCSFQNSVMAIASQADAETRGLAVGTRNMLRFFGGALGTAISSAVMPQRLHARLPPGLVDFHRATATFSHASLKQFNPEQEKAVQAAYGNAITWVFAIAAAMVYICFSLCPFIEDKSQRQIMEEEAAEQAPPANNAEQGNNIELATIPNHGPACARRPCVCPRTQAVPG